MVVECPHKGVCPGCTYLGTAYDTQLAAKATTLASALAAYPALSHVTVDPTAAAPTIERYRTRVKWVVGPRGEIGLYADGEAHQVVDVPLCRIAGELSVRIAAELRELVGGAAGPLRAIDIREIAAADGPRAMVTLVVESGADPSAVERLATELHHRISAIASIFVNERAPNSAQILGPRTRRLIGASSLVDRVGTVGVIATAGSFVQAHRAQAVFIEERLVERASRLARELDTPLRVLELYAGSGALGLALARAGHEVTFVESYGPAAESIAKAAGGFASEVRAITEDAELFVRNTKRQFDMVVVDPPRRGLPPALRGRLARLAPRAVAYVSCDPETFARDLAHLASVGFTAENATPIDMLPLTSHVEALAFLTLGAPPPARELARSAGLVVLEKPPHLAVKECAPSSDVRALLDLERGVSGALPFAGPTDSSAVTASARCLVNGVTRAKGHIRASGARATYERVSVAAGHSEIVIRFESTHPASLSNVLDRLAAFGHAPLGDGSRAHPAALRHAFDARGIDRAMVHVEHVRIARGASVVEATCPPAPDFARALVRLRQTGGLALNHS